MKKIPELSAPAQRAVSPKDVPSPDRLAAALQAVREKRADVADVFEFMSLTGIRWGEARALRVNWLSEVPFAQLVVESSHSDRYDEKVPKTWRGTRAAPLSPRALSIFSQCAMGKQRDDYVFTNTLGAQLSVGVVRKFPLGFHRHALRHYAASTWLRLGTPIHEESTRSLSISATSRAPYSLSTPTFWARANAARTPHDSHPQRPRIKRGTPGGHWDPKLSEAAPSRRLPIKKNPRLAGVFGGDGGI